MSEKISGRLDGLLPSERRRNLGIIGIRQMIAGKSETGLKWGDDAACRNHENPDLFFPEGKEGRWIAQIEDAKKICVKCLVKDKCLEYALSTHSDEGIWGGLTEDERRAYRRKEQRRTQK